MDWTSVTRDGFRQLCKDLLVAEQYTIRAVDTGIRGADFVVSWAHSNEPVAVEIVHTARSLHPGRRLREGIDRLHFFRQLGFEKGLLIMSSDFEPRSEDLERFRGIAVWDRAKLEELVGLHKISPVGLSNKTALDKDVRAQRLWNSLQSLPPGREHWPQFEILCTDILNYLFCPPLVPGGMQTWSEDGLDRRDAIYSFDITAENRVWQRILNDCGSRFVVVDFKNLSDQPTQRDVESVQQYLFTKALRTFGIVCSRSAPSESALKARRRTWLESGKLIVLLADGDLKKMLEYKAEGKDPVDVIDGQLDEFFRDLAP